MQLNNSLRKFCQLTCPERWLFVEAYVLTGVMRAALLVLPFRRIAMLMGLEQGGFISTTEQNTADSVPYVSWAVQTAAAHTPWESACLVQGLTAMFLLSRRGITSTLFLGVAKDEKLPEMMAAHAWLECGGSIVTGANGFERYAVISSFTNLAPSKVR